MLRLFITLATLLVSAFGVQGKLEQTSYYEGTECSGTAHRIIGVQTVFCAKEQCINIPSRSVRIPSHQSFDHKCVETGGVLLPTSGTYLVREKQCGSDYQKKVTAYVADGKCRRDGKGAGYYYTATCKQGKGEFTKCKDSACRVGCEVVKPSDCVSMSCLNGGGSVGDRISESGNATDTIVGKPKDSGSKNDGAQFKSKSYSYASALITVVMFLFY